MNKKLLSAVALTCLAMASVQDAFGEYFIASNNGKCYDGSSYFVRQVDMQLCTEQAESANTSSTEKDGPATSPPLTKSVPAQMGAQPAPPPLVAPVPSNPGIEAQVAMWNSPKGKQCRALEMDSMATESNYMKCFFADQRSQDEAIKLTAAYAECKTSKTKICPVASMNLSYQRCKYIKDQGKAMSASLLAVCGIGSTKPNVGGKAKQE